MTSEKRPDLYDRADIAICEALLFMRRRQYDSSLRKDNDAVVLRTHIHALEQSIDSLDTLNSTPERKGYIHDIQDVLYEIEEFSC